MSKQNEIRSMTNILIVEDCPEVRQIVVLSLQDSCELVEASTIKEASEALEHTKFSLIILDVIMPDGNGYDFCRLLKTTTKFEAIPVIFLTAKDDIQDKLRGFSLGAEDYVVKPFDPMELRARVKSRLQSFERTKKLNSELLVGNLLFMENNQRAYIVNETNHQQIDLTPVEYRLLHFFATHEEDVFNRDQLLEAIWLDNLKVFDRTVDTHICNLRKKINHSRCSIKSVHGIGYSFVQEDA
jgi:DNA-binding response OmpR family regulator